MNRTITLTASERRAYARRLVRVDGPVALGEIENRTICGDLDDVAGRLPAAFADLLFLDPPYNLDKRFGGARFAARPVQEYAAWLASWLPRLLPALRPGASVYICGDWRSSAAIHEVAGRHLRLRSRITWEREKGRGARRNWKSTAEDVWFCTVSDRYTFNVDSVKLVRRVVAPYTDAAGRPKGWARAAGGGGLRLTHPSNLWTDLTVPFWSMPENTEHPTQKPEKLLAKIILASTSPGDLVLDPFLGSGTASVAAKKLGRRYVGIERDERYCCLAEKRLALAEADRAIQGYEDGVFWERNAAPARRPKKG